jgi:DNA-binding IclR family transcriptional regulator
MSMGSPGTQLITRATTLLRTLSEVSPNGVSTIDAADAAGLTRPTAHRILTALAGQGFVDHDSRNGRWYLGPELYLLGSQAASRYDIADLAWPSVTLLAEQTGESAFLSARRGMETVCLIREEGSFPIRSFVLSEGVRFPLGVASAGMAIIAFLEDDELEAYLADTPLVAAYGPEHSAEKIRSRIAQTRELGYSVNPGLVLEGSWGMGTTIFDREGRPSWALSLTGVESRFKPARQAELGALLLEQAHVITRKLQATPRIRARGG